MLEIQTAVSYTLFLLFSQAAGLADTLSDVNFVGTILVQPLENFSKCCKTIAEISLGSDTVSGRLYFFLQCISHGFSPCPPYQVGRWQGHGGP